MKVLDPKFNIVTYAVVSYTYNENKNVIKSFLPLIEAALVNGRNTTKTATIQKNKLPDLFFELYGYRIPMPILHDLLQLLRQQRKIKFRNELIEIHFDKFENLDDHLDLKLRMLINEFELFIISKAKEIDNNIIAQIIFEFIYENAYEMGSFFNYQSNFLAQEDKEYEEYEKEIIDFLLIERSKCSECYKFIEEIYSGVIIASLLQLNRNQISSINNESFKIENVLLDSNVIFRLLDLQTQYECVASNETLELLKRNNCKLWISSITIKQINNTIAAFARDINPAFTHGRFFDEKNFSGLYSAYLRQQLTAAKLHEISISLIDELESKFGISLFPEPMIEEEQIEHEEIESLQLVKPDAGVSGIIHDLRLVATVKNKRESTTITDLNLARWWVLTDDYKLTNWCNSKHLLPECITESQLSTLYWLKDPQSTTTTGLCNTVLTLRNKNLFDSIAYKKVTAEIEAQKKRFEKNPKQYDKFGLLFSTRCLSVDEILKTEPKDVDDLFDKKMIEAAEIVNKKDIESEQLKKSINNLEIERINGLRLISEEKNKYLDLLQKSLANQINKQKEAKCKINKNTIIFTVISSILIVILFGILELGTNLLSFINNNFAITLYVLIFLGFINFVAIYKPDNKENLIIKVFDAFNVHKYNQLVQKKKLPDFDIEISKYKIEIEKAKDEINIIEKDIEEKLNQLK